MVAYVNQCGYKLYIIRINILCNKRGNERSDLPFVYTRNSLNFVYIMFLASSCLNTSGNGVASRIESGPDEPDNLDHFGPFFGGSSGSYLQTKLSGRDLDITCSLETVLVSGK